MGYKLTIFTYICDTERENFNLHPSFAFKYNIAMTRISRSRLEGHNKQSQLIFIDEKIVQLVICMNNIKRSLSVSKGLCLVNEIIIDTDMQGRLIEWKLANNIYYEHADDLGKVGRSYWNKFLKRNHYRLRTKKGRKFGCDRANYSSYLNFVDMFKHIAQVLIESCKIARKLEVPMWFDKNGKCVVDEMDGYGCKVELVIDRPDMGIFMDEVGCNISQEMDNAIEGQRFLTSVTGQAIETSSTRDHHFTCLGYWVEK